MADWIFDGVNKIIKEPVGAGNTTFDVQRDIYSAWKRWVNSGNAEYDSAFSVEGGTPIGATGLITGSTFILENGWKLMAADHDHQALLVGNLYSSDGVVSTANPVGNSTIFVSSSVAAQGIESGISGLTPEESNQLLNLPELIMMYNILADTGDDSFLTLLKEIAISAKRAGEYNFEQP